jgi:hypothetical protein
MFAKVWGRFGPRELSRALLADKDAAGIFDSSRKKYAAQAEATNIATEMVNLYCI